MTERQEEQAALHALGMLEDGEARILETELRMDAKLSKALSDYEEIAALITTQLPAEPLPEDLRRTLLREARAQRSNGSALTVASHLLASPWVAWTAAVIFASVAGYLWWKQEATSKAIQEYAQRDAAALARDQQDLQTIDHLKQTNTEATAQNQKLQQTIADLKAINPLTNLELFLLRPSSLARFEKAEGSVVWDAERQEGRIRLRNLPPPPPRKSYHLWITDKSEPGKYISAGPIPVKADGSGGGSFKLTAPASKIGSFFLNVENEGAISEKTEDSPAALTVTL